MRFLSSRLENGWNSLVQSIQNHLDLSFFKYSKGCLFNHYIAYVPIYHTCHNGLNQNHKKLFYYIFYTECVLPYFRLVKEEKGKKLIERELRVN